MYSLHALIHNQVENTICSLVLACQLCQQVPVTTCIQLKKLVPT